MRDARNFPGARMQSQHQGKARCHLPELATIITNDLDHQRELQTSTSIKRAHLGGPQHKHSSGSSVQTQVVTSSSSVSLSSSSGNSSASSSNGGGGAEIFELPLVSNSALVHQRAKRSISVSDQLAAAAARTGASLPLMIGNRSKCVVNLLEQDHREQEHQQQQIQPPASVTNPTAVAPGPQNTALRAEQRRQNMSVSVVRPVVAVASSPAPPACPGADKATSLLDNWMTFDAIKQPTNQAVVVGRTGASSGFLDELLSLHELDTNLIDKQQVFASGDVFQHSHRSEQEMRQQVILLRREQHELARGVRRHHEFMVHKLEERRRHLAIIQSVWAQRDFKHAIEKLVDIYQQGLIFTNSSSSTPTAGGGSNGPGAKLRSLNTSLAVDVIGIIILRPRLWTLDICQLLLPIINQDLLGAGPQATPTQPSPHEYYADVGLKALRLILTNFSSVITSTLESLKDSSKLVGIDLSREDRINKCLACYRLLLDSRSILSTSSNTSASNKLAGQHRELQSMFSTLFNSLKTLEPNILARRLQSGGVS